MTELEHNSTYSEDNSSLSEEERIKKLFQAFNSCADGLIDGQDLISICRALNIEGTVEELMHEVDANGRISFSQFLQQQSNIKLDIEPLNNSQQLDYPASSNNSLGVPSGSKNDRWEFDSGARDLSPEPHAMQKFMEVVTAGTSSNSTNSSNLLLLANKLHLAALASLRSEILDLSTRLQTVTEEKDLLEKSLVQSKSVIEASVAQQYEEKLRRLKSVIVELSLRSDNGQPKALVMPDEEDERTLSVETEHVTDYFSNFQDVPVNNNSPLYNNSNDVACNTTDTLLSSNKNEEIVKHSPEKLFNRKKVEELMQNIIDLQAENARLHSKLSVKDVEIKKLRSSFISSKENQHSKGREKHNSKTQNERTVVTPSLQNPPVPKVAERVRLRRMDRHVTGSDIVSLGVSHTEVAEHLVSSVLEQCNLLEIGNDHRKFEIETERLISKLEHTRAFNTLLQSSLEEVKSYCERLTLLVGKYENNAIALQLALGCNDRVIRAYEELVSLMSNGSNENYEIEEKHLIQLIDDLKKERLSIEGAVVQLESHVEPPAPLPQIPTQARKLDLETAVLIQEVMSMREEKADLNATIYGLEKEKESLELKLTTMETQQQTQLATVQHLKMLHESIPENQEKCSEVQKEKILRDQLKEMAATVEHVSRNAEARQKQHAEMMVELRTTNSSLLKTIEKNKHKYEARLHRLEAQMLTMVSRHAAQVQALKQRILQLLDDKNKEHQW